MPGCKLSPEERAAEKERKENLRNLMQGLDVKKLYTKTEHQKENVLIMCCFVLS